jgi:hypothetical protein
LRRHAFETAEGGDSYKFAVGGGELCAGEDVAEEVRLEVIVILRAECVVEGAA